MGWSLSTAEGKNLVWVPSCFPNVKVSEDSECAHLPTAHGPWMTLVHTAHCTCTSRSAL